MYLNIAILKELNPNERRVALDPLVAEKLVKNGAKMAVQRGAWDYAQLSGITCKGMFFTEDKEELLGDADIVLSIQAPTLDIIDALQEDAILITHEHPGNNAALVQRLLDRNITSFVLKREAHDIYQPLRTPRYDTFNMICAMVKNNVIDLDWNIERLADAVFTHGGAVWHGKPMLMPDTKRAFQTQADFRECSTSYFSST